MSPVLLSLSLFLSACAIPFIRECPFAPLVFCCPRTVRGCAESKRLTTTFSFSFSASSARMLPLSRHPAEAGCPPDVSLDAGGGEQLRTHQLIARACAGLTPGSIRAKRKCLPYRRVLLSIRDESKMSPGEPLARAYAVFSVLQPDGGIICVKSVESAKMVMAGWKPRSGGWCHEDSPLDAGGMSVLVSPSLSYDPAIIQACDTVWKTALAESPPQIEVVSLEQHHREVAITRWMTRYSSWSLCQRKSEPSGVSPRQSKRARSPVPAPVPVPKRLATAASSVLIQRSPPNDESSDEGLPSIQTRGAMMHVEDEAENETFTELETVGDASVLPPIVAEDQSDTESMSDFEPSAVEDEADEVSAATDETDSQTHKKVRFAEQPIVYEIDDRKQLAIDSYAALVEGDSRKAFAAEDIQWRRAAAQRGAPIEIIGGDWWKYRIVKRSNEVVQKFNRFMDSSKNRRLYTPQLMHSRIRVISDGVDATGMLTARLGERAGRHKSRRLEPSTLLYLGHSSFKASRDLTSRLGLLTPPRQLGAEKTSWNLQLKIDTANNHIARSVSEKASRTILTGFKMQPPIPKRRAKILSGRAAGCLGDLLEAAGHMCAVQLDNGDINVTRQSNVRWVGGSHGGSS